MLPLNIGRNIMRLHFDWKEFIKTPNLLSTVTKLLLLTFFVIAIFFQDFIEVFNLAIGNSEIQYILIVPLIAGFFFYKHRKAFFFSRENTHLEDLAGAATCLMALVIYIYGSYSLFPVELHLLTLPIFLAGTLLLFFGKDTLRTLFFPTALLIFLSPFPVFFSAQFGGYFIDSATTASAAILKVFLPIQVALRPDSVISLVSRTGQSITFEIAPACSGIYSLISMTFFSVIFLYITSGSWIKKILFASLALLTAFLLNVLRIVLMVTLGYSFGYGLAVEFFHDFGGVTLLFVGALLLLVVGDKLLKLSFMKETVPTCTHSNKGAICFRCGKIFKFPKTPLNWKRLSIILLFLLITTALFMQASAATYNIASNDKTKAIDLNPSTGDTSAFSDLTGWSTQFLVREPSSEERLGLYYVGDYTLYASNGSSINAILEVSDTQSKFHTWEGCLNYQSTPMTITKTTVLTLYDQNNMIVTAENMIADIPAHNQKLVLLYWFDSANLKVNDTVTPWALKITLYTTIDNSTDSTQTTNQLNQMGTQIESSWSQYKNTSSGFSADIYRNITAAFLLAAGLLFASIIVLKVKSTLKSQSTAKKFTQLPETDQQYIKNFNKKTNLNDETTNTDELKLQELQKAGFLKQKYTLKNNQPYVTWANNTK